MNETLQWLVNNSNRKNTNGTLAYVALGDYIHHNFYPGTQEANEYYNQIDGFIEKIDKMNGIIAVTSPNGINDKIDFEDNPRIIDVESLLKNEYGIDHVKLAVSDYVILYVCLCQCILYVYLCQCINVYENMKV